VAAGYADRVVFLADGRVVRELSEPTAEKVLDVMGGLDVLAGAPAPAGMRTR
jgi:putative ABC transport system ATP-binding protein